MNRRDVTGILTLVLALMAATAPSPAWGQWSQVSEVPTTDIFSVWTRGDTIAAGSSGAVFVSVDAGASWIPSASLATDSTMIEAVRVHDGLLYAGTLGYGVFVSSDLGASWQSFNQGLVGGSQFYIADLLLRGDTLYAATGGAGPWVRNLAIAGAWSDYGNEIELAQSGVMASIAGSPTRLLACGGFIGDVFYRDPGDADWTESLLFNDHLAAGLAPLAAIWTGQSWLVGSNIGVFHSQTGQSPWTYFDFGLHPTLFASFAVHDRIVFTHFANGAGTGIEYSTDDGVTWQVLDAQPSIFVYAIAVIGNTLYAARTDGLWRRSIETVSVPAVAARASLHFAIVGANPVRDEARFRFELPQAARVRIELFDVAGRREPGDLDESLPGGVQEARLDARDLAPGVYLARLSAAGRSESVRLVRVQ